MLKDLVTLNIFGFLLIFARIGTTFAMMPGVSASYVPTRVRLGLALAVSFVIAPVLAVGLPTLPPTVPGLALLVAGEILVGAFFGTIARIMFASLQTAGTVIAYSSSMANALIQDPIAEQQSATISGFLLAAGLVAVFVTDMHHLMIRAVIDSYDLFQPGHALPFSDLAHMMGRYVADSFRLGLQMAAPFVVAGLTYYIGLGLLGRLMPQLQVFFFGLPFQITAQIWVMTVAFSGILLAFMNHFAEGYAPFLAP